MIQTAANLAIQILEAPVPLVVLIVTVALLMELVFVTLDTVKLATYILIHPSFALLVHQTVVHAMLMVLVFVMGLLNVVWDMAM